MSDRDGVPSEESAMIAVGVELLAHLEHPELSVKEAMDRIELVTAEPAMQRRILEAAVEDGAIERDSTTVRPKRGSHINFTADVVTREGEFECRRCGASLTTGHFVQFDPGELGPFGSQCIRKVTGRD